MSESVEKHIFETNEQNLNLNKNQCILATGAITLNYRVYDSK